ncbi:MAG: hypothetical protein II920_05430 [Clostridia bacterium]|nr:hypothetical protein [Clostridia bacterium]
MNWDEPSEALGGKTPLEVACLGYLEHVSQQSRYSMSQGKIFDYTKYSLIYSTVGNDVLKNDFLENTSAAD